MRKVVGVLEGWVRFWSDVKISTVVRVEEVEQIQQLAARGGLV